MIEAARRYSADVRHITTKYAHLITPTALLLGFVLDNLLLQRIDTAFTLITLGAHFTIVTLSILLLAYLQTHHTGGKYIDTIRALLRVALPFSFGALFSGFFIFYSQSAGAVYSWIFLTLLLLFMISTEYYKHRYTNALVQVTLWYFTLFSFLLLLVPILLSKMGGFIFLLSGGISLLLAFGLLRLLVKYSGAYINPVLKRSLRNIALIFVSINIMYFANVIPPIPLALKDIDVYYYVERSGNSYYALANTNHWYNIASYLPTTLYLSQGEPAYAYSSVFAPSHMTLQLRHKWQYKGASGSWQTVSTIPFTIIGGREAGYRAYSIKESVRPGKWRVQVVTSRGQVVGSTRFNIKVVSSEHSKQRKQL